VGGAAPIVHAAEGGGELATCSTCKKEDAPGRGADMPWLQCDACEKWFHAHPQCLELEKSAVQKLLLEAEDPTADEWVCKGCE